MKIIDMKDGFIMADHVVAVRLNYKTLWVYASDDVRFDFAFDSKEHAKDCIRKLKRFIRSTNHMEDLFSIEEQPGYVGRMD